MGSDKSYFAAILVILLVVSHCHALDPQKKIFEYDLEIFSTEKGLPQSAVMALLQSKTGYIWLGTYEGLARFDGLSFAVFDKTNVALMPNSTIKALFQDKKNRMWIATPNGLLCKKKETFSLYTEKDGLSDNFILSVFEDSRQRLWVGTTNGLNLLDGNRFRAFYPGGTGQNRNYISAIGEDSGQRLWLGTESGLFYAENPVTGEFRKMLDLDIRTIYCDSDGRLWIGTRGRGLGVYSGGDFKFFGKSRGLDSTDIRAILQDSRGTLWIGSNGNGLYRFREGVFSNLSSRQGLPGDSVRSLLEDHEGSIWVGMRNGMAQLRDSRFVLYNSRNGLPADEIRCGIQDRKGVIWIGTVGSGLVRYQNEKFSSFSDNYRLPSLHVWSLAESPGGALWIGTYGGGLLRYYGKKLNRLKDRRGFPGDVVRCVFVNRENEVWAGTNGEGISVIRSGEMVHFNRKNGLPSDFVYSINQDKSGAMLVGTYDAGLTRYQNGRFTPVGLEKGLDRHAIWAICVDSSNNVFLGTNDGGLVRLRGNRINRYTIADGLFSDTAFQILEDRENRLWMNCNKGVYHISKQSLDEFDQKKINSIPCVSFGRAQGFRGLETSGPAQPAGWQAADGKLWFPTIRGVAVIDPEHIWVNRTAPPVVIEKVIINNRVYRPYETVEVDPGSCTAEFEFTGLSYYQPDQVKFRYKLEGQDTDWVFSGERRFVTYTNLGPGHYRFRVTGCNSDGVWNPEEAGFSFEVRADFFHSLWFYLLGFLAFVIFMLATNYLTVKRIRQREKRLSEVVKQRTFQLDKANSELKKINLKLQDANMNLKYLARMDGLTGIPNHRYFMENIEREWRIALRQSLEVSLLFVDIDFFKAYNDTQGHQKGDECLKAVAALMKMTFQRPRDFVARYGGEEFVVILPTTPREGAMQAAEKLRQGIENLKIPHGNSQAGPWVTASLGVTSTVPRRADNTMLFIRAADQALYMAKNRGRNRCEFLAAESPKTAE